MIRNDDVAGDVLAFNNNLVGVHEDGEFGIGLLAIHFSYGMQKAVPNREFGGLGVAQRWKCGGVEGTPGPAFGYGFLVNNGLVDDEIAVNDAGAIVSGRADV